MGKLDKLKSQIPQGSQELSTKNHLAKTEIAMSFQNEGTELTRILLRNIEFNPHNLWSCNDDDESIQQLADAIERNGLLHNIVVSQREDGTFMLLSGERRVKALRLLQKREQESDPTGQKAHKWDRVQAQTYTGLDELSELEKENATDIDRVSGCFFHRINCLFILFVKFAFRQKTEVCMIPGVTSDLASQRQFSF